MVFQSAGCLDFIAKENCQCSFKIATTATEVTLVRHMLAEIIIRLVVTILPKEICIARDIRVIRSETDTWMLFLHEIEEGTKLLCDRMVRMLLFSILSFIDIDKFGVLLEVYTE